MKFFCKSCTISFEKEPVKKEYQDAVFGRCEKNKGFSPVTS